MVDEKAPKAVFDATTPEERSKLATAELHAAQDETSELRKALEDAALLHTRELMRVRAIAQGRRSEEIRKMATAFLAGLMSDSAMLMATDETKRRERVRTAIAWAKLADEELSADEMTRVEVESKEADDTADLPSMRTVRPT